MCVCLFVVYVWQLYCAHDFPPHTTLFSISSSFFFSVSPMFCLRLFCILTFGAQMFRRRLLNWSLIWVLLSIQTYLEYFCKKFAPLVYRSNCVRNWKLISFRWANDSTRKITICVPHFQAKFYNSYFSIPLSLFLFCSVYYFPPSLPTSRLHHQKHHALHAYPNKHCQCCLNNHLTLLALRPQTPDENPRFSTRCAHCALPRTRLSCK